MTEKSDRVFSKITSPSGSSATSNLRDVTDGSLVVGCVALEKSLDAIENLIATHRENRTHKTNNTYFVGLLFATGIRCVRIGVCKTIRFCRLTHPTPLSAPMICYAPIASQFLTFAIANNLSELNNKTNYFCLPNLG
ncbi:hypothetical protein QT971_15735 [Microcoleus sp. herbarium19]|uniref:hypothetical protein n=1 Tax=unclassified Microcoleus TaxID=2642155 RepID=UPI002FD309E5